MLDPIRLLTPFILCLLMLNFSPLHAAKYNPKKDWDILPDLNITLTQKGSYSESKDRNGGNRKLESRSFETALGHDEKLNEGSFSLYGFLGYDHYLAETIIPMNDYYRYGLDTFYTEKQWDDWGVWMMGVAEITGHSDTPSSLRIKQGTVFKLGLGPSYAVNKDLTLFVGAVGATRLEDSNQLIPVAGLLWQLTPKLTIRTANGVFATYDFFEDQKLRLELSSEFRYKQYRLKNASIATTVGNQGQAMVDRGIYSHMAITYKVLDNFWVRGFSGFVSKRKISAKSASKTITQVKGKTGFDIGAQAGYSF